MNRINENRPGYKKTKVGWIPEEWKVRKLIELSINGISNGVFNDPQKVGSGYRLINVLDLYTKPTINTSKLKLINISQEEFLKNKVKWGDIFFTRSSLKPEGIAHCNVNLDDSDNITFDGHIMKLTPNQELVYPLFLTLFCLTYSARKILISRAKLNTMTTIGQSDIKDISIPLPPLPEQKKIAAMLSTWDKAIEKLEALVAAKEKRKKGLMQQLLTGKRRLPGFDKEWLQYKLSQCLKQYLRPVNKPAANYLSLGIRSHCKGIFHKLNFKPGEIAIDTLYEVRANDLIVNITFAWEGAVAIAESKDEGGLVSHRFPTYTFNGHYAIPDFFKYLIITKRFRYYLILISPGGAGRNRVMNKNDFLKIKVSIPEVKEQKAIAAVLLNTDKEIKLHRQQLKKLKAQKQGLMQVLLTGKIRVKV